MTKHMKFCSCEVECLKGKKKKQPLRRTCIGCKYFIGSIKKYKKYLKQKRAEKIKKIKEAYRKSLTGDSV
jgi:hypothetical protein